MKPRTDSPEYLRRKTFLDGVITIYGRKPVLEALQDRALQIYRLHLAISNRDGGVIAEIESLARKREIEILHHSREQLARISRNGKQDQGVACDVICKGLANYREFLESLSAGHNKCLMALDGVHNPQNLGMIIRTVAASPLSGLLVPRKGCADISPLVIKASAGTLFRSTLLRCETLPQALREFRDRDFDICTLAADGAIELREFRARGPTLYVLGNETSGVSNDVEALCTHRLRIAMANGVESLNVAVTAGLVAFAPATVVIPVR